MAALGVQNRESLGSLEYKELQALAKCCGVKANLSKDKLIEHLLKDASSDNTGDGSANLGPTVNRSSENVQVTQPTSLTLCNQQNSTLITMRLASVGNDAVKDATHMPSLKHMPTVPIESRPRTGDPETKEQADRGKRVPNQDKVSASQEISKQPESEKRRPTTANRFDLAHQHLFDSQPSIERYGRTPKKTGTKINTLAGKTPVCTAGASRDETKVVAEGPPETPTFPSIAKDVKKGVTVASRPCTLTIQPSRKKPTQVKEFHLSSNGKREGFTFKPYTGPVPPITPAPATLTDKTRAFNMGRSAQKPRDKAHQSVHAVGVKDNLASGKARAARRASHAQSSKVRRGERIAQERAGRA